MFTEHPIYLLLWSFDLYKNIYNEEVNNMMRIETKLLIY